MKERGILMSAPMVLATLDGRKTQTRRIAMPRHDDRTPCAHWSGAMAEGRAAIMSRHCEHGSEGRGCPYGAPGDQLWVRETWRPWWDPEEWACVQYQADAGVMKPDTWDEQQGFWCESVGDENAERDAKGMTPRWRPSIHMPRWASRLTLEVVGVRVERVQEITEADATAEGIEMVWLQVGKYSNPVRHYRAVPDRQGGLATAVEAFSLLWDSINAKRGYGWAENPWVWVIEFKRAKGATE